MQDKIQTELIGKIFNLVVEDDNQPSKQKIPKSINCCEQLRIILEILTQKQVQDSHRNYKELEKQLQKYESEVRQHIRDEYLMQQHQEDLITRVDELEKDRNELLTTTKQIITKLKRENEELYQKVKSQTLEIQQLKDMNQKITNQFERLKTNDHLTQQSTKISQSKYSTLETASIIMKQEQLFKQKPHKSPQKFHTETSMDMSFNAVANQKRLSQQFIKPTYFNKTYNKQQYMKNKRQSCQFMTQQLQITQQQQKFDNQYVIYLIYFQNCIFTSKLYFKNFDTLSLFLSFYQGEAHS